MDFLKSKEITFIPHKRFNNLIKEKSLRLNTNPDTRTLFDWSIIEHSPPFFYDFNGCEIEIAKRLKKSKIGIERNNLLIDLGPNCDIIKVSADFFIENWYDFLVENGFMGMVVVSEDLSCILEFTDDAHYLCYSNFILKDN